MIRIAIVDDNEKMKDIIKNHLTNAIDDMDNIKIHTFSDAVTFWEDAERQNYDILFSDIQMAEMNGLELGKKIRDLLPDIYIIFITTGIKLYTLAFHNIVLENRTDVRYNEGVK